MAISTVVYLCIVMHYAMLSHPRTKAMLNAPEIIFCFVFVAFFTPPTRNAAYERNILKIVATVCSIEYSFILRLYARRSVRGHKKKKT